MSYVRHVGRHLRRTMIQRLTTQMGSLGWLADPGPMGATPVEILTRRARESELQAITGNVLGIYFGQESDDEAAQLGGGLLTVTTLMACDVVATKDAYGISIASDVKDFLSGRTPGGTRMFPLLDFTTDDDGVPLADHMVEVTKVTRQRPENVETKLWWQVLVAELELTIPGDE